MKKVIFIQLIVLLGFWILFLGFQSQDFYSKTLGLVSRNWQNEQGERTLVNRPFKAVTNDDFIQWDAVHYNFIRNNGYNVAKAGGDYIFAFFPLFPALWRITGLPPVGILFLNYALLSLSIIIFLRLFSSRAHYLYNTIIALSFPSIAIFFIPYSEATFLFAISVGLYGFVRDRYWIFFLGLLLASLARPSYTMLGLSIIAAEFFYLFEHRSVRTFFQSSFLRTLPLICGTLLVSMIQYFQGSGSFFKFIEVQKYWNNVLAVPHNLRDWSQEGFSINVGVLFLVFVPLLVIVLQLFFGQLSRKQAERLHHSNSTDYLMILSAIYLIANSLFILFFRGGSLNCLFRFTLCSPFFFVLLFGGFPYIQQVPAKFRLFVIGVLSMLTIFVLGLADYSTYWNFSDAGLIIMIGGGIAWVLQDFKSHIWHKVGLVLLITLNLIWTTYLLNTYIANGWIFA